MIVEPTEYVCACCGQRLYRAIVLGDPVPWAPKRWEGKPVCKVCFSALERQQAAEFTLANTPAPHRPMQFANDECRQRSLLAGLDCLPGQGDLFATDGEPEKTLPASA
jgi:hypothetical protein